MKFNVLSLFPEFFSAFTQIGVVGRAKEQGLWSLQLINPRSFADNKHGQIDDRPYGGGAGMVMSYEPLRKALLSCHSGFSLSEKKSTENSKIVYLSPAGDRFTQAKAKQYAQLHEITLICGRYEGVDQRFIEAYVDEEISVGDFVLSGGEPAALCVMDAVIRFLPHVLGNDHSLEDESYSEEWDGLLDYPQYTRPEEVEGHRVPNVLLKGDHQRIDRWRRLMSLQRTIDKRPDLMNDTLYAEYQKHAPKHADKS